MDTDFNEIIDYYFRMFIMSKTNGKIVFDEIDYD